MRKGITPIISVIILLLITIALAGAAWTFLQGVLLSQTAKTFSVPTGGAFCTSGKITVMAVNIGTSKLEPADFAIFVVTKPDGTTLSPAITNTVETGKSAKILDAYDCGGTTCASGSYQISIGTTASVQQISVLCP